MTKKFISKNVISKNLDWEHTKTSTVEGDDL